ncbi:MAG: hypothetical protein AB1505_27660 [Candidatus Latescibacterota bacterium]
MIGWPCCQPSSANWLDAQPHAELPRYLAALDVLFLPYVRDDFTRHVYPAKMHQCLALGKPVVATALPALEPFAHVVRQNVWETRYQEIRRLLDEVLSRSAAGEPA